MLKIEQTLSEICKGTVVPKPIKEEITRIKSIDDRLDGKWLLICIGRFESVGWLFNENFFPQNALGKELVHNVA